MSIVHETKHSRLKPRRGGMVVSQCFRAAPTELRRSIASAFTIDMSLLRSWPWAPVIPIPSGLPPTAPCKMTKRQGHVSDSARDRRSSQPADQEVCPTRLAKMRLAAGKGAYLDGARALR
jgi:hypothetical protein